MKKAIETPNAPQAIGPYSQGIVVDNFVFISGQIHLTLDGKLVEGTIEEQMHQVMKNLRAILEASNLSFKDVVKVTLYITNILDFDKVNEVYKSYMIEPFPARETFGVKELPRGAKIEMSVIAMKD
jgi:2-iminobutanoate/2-iminopropanoate deaminase